MKTLIATIGAVVLLGLFMSKAAAADALRPDSEGYIRHWVMLAPVALRDGETCAEALLKEQIKDEAALRPKAGDKVKVAGKELVWQNITASTNYFDFNEVLKSMNDHAAGYIVTYALMLLSYTLINVPYSAMLGVISPSPRTRTVA